ncbi:bifunctional 4-hydroxy-2-oxoglutarate aldolase/2-dehydro-3-deoxy-phosphogluconate aldolase [Haloarcula onubensis]|uniref:Bifunctional 4-hydroxy-2-oxoglutarate aldolase/2-dehydro-3-deoxy-phosphogluconate aldolase n=1 Tax=Haloarcula onubensis TaxID=2950539 RepID=A0ABU2FK02_9EURY|nr:bifunctional 4-hydroxy-2-oxoglutarate aldolase/2-dehydro-3-deoxy-phosphogluconate aldolase [Halomicroarcula sp. S3CR25-11]MDS0280676.1 bifunctional 4-hydroxy-2-oxoglutarate aldolase/2-dehydro-3-deoxy-phosphogluconate aldolase [Halomicroarcula sp. S3CR25-11]
MSKAEVHQRVVDSGVIAILRGIPSESATDVVRAIAAGGIDTIEITVDTPGAVEMIRRVSDEVDDVVVGAGTVLDAETARAVQLAGAEFIVTPTVDTGVIEMANRYGTPVATGVMTPTEAQTATEAGADFCKLFPASTVGPGHVGAINGPLSQVPLVPTGGVTLDNAAAFFEAGAVALGVGSAIVDADAIDAGEFDALTETASEFARLAEAHR